METLDISSISKFKTTQVNSEVQVKLQKKQVEQQAQVVSSLVESAAPKAPERPGSGKLLTVA